MRQPYGRSIASTPTYAHPSWWAERGFLVVVQDVRGQGSSGGCFRGFEQEARDTTATLSWLRSLPQCNGRIGLYGFSYQGFTQLVAEEGTPPPDCLAPAMTGLHERDHWSCEGGAHWWHLGLGWGLQLAALQAQRRGDATGWDAIRCSLEDNRYCRDGLDLLRRYDPEGMAVRWLDRSPEDPDAWTCYHPPTSWLRLPMLLIGGWWDPHLRGVLDLHRLSLEAGGQPDLHIGPATHLKWWPNAQQLHLDFFQRNLIDPSEHPSIQREEPVGCRGSVMAWDLCEQRWQPITDARSSSGGLWQLSGSSLACLDPSAGELKALSSASHARGCFADPSVNEQDLNRSKTVVPETVVIVHDPWRAAPAIGGHLSPTPGPCDRSELDARSDVATFTTAPLSLNCQLRGRPVLSLLAAADQLGFDLCVALSVCPSGSDQVQQLSTGVTRVSGLKACQASSQRVALQPLEARLKPGDRLRISIAGACWPAIAINPGHPDSPCGAPSSACRVTSIELTLNQCQLRFEPLIGSPER